MNEGLVFRRDDISIKINSFVIASSIVINVIYSVFTTSYGIEGISSAYLLAVYALGIVNILFSRGGVIEFRNGRHFVFLEGMLLIACVLTLVFASDTTTLTMFDYIFYCFLPVFFLMFEYDAEKIIRYGMYISLVSILGINTLLVDQAISSRFAQTELGTIYDLLPCVILAMFHFAYYRKSASRVTKVIYIYYLYVLARMIPVIVRGAMLTLLIGVVIIFLNKPSNEGNSVSEWSIWKKLLVLVGIVLAILVIWDFNAIIEWIYTFLTSRGINFGFITKFHFYIQSGNITDNREPYYELVRETFKQSPIYGRGVQTFSAYSEDGVGYPHNYILQFLFEGGLLLMLPLAFISLRDCYRVLTTKYVDVDKLALHACLILLSVVPGMFSMNIWYNRTFWLLIMLGLQDISKRCSYNEVENDLQEKL